MVFNLLLGSFVVYVVMGISIEVGVYYIMFVVFGEMFYYLNLCILYVFGYLFQCLEMYCIYYQCDCYECNYSDFLIWDMLFGIYENFCCIDELQGFVGDKEQQFVDMLLFCDVYSFFGKIQFVFVLVKFDVR